jgi:D-aspartate ligase
LEFLEKEFIPVILGSDINTYSMARAFYEEYKTKSIVLGKSSTGPSCNSRIIEFRADANMDKKEVFVKTINALAEEYSNKKVLLIGCGDSYVELIILNRAELRENVIVPYIEKDLMESLLTKKKFYEMCDKHGVDYPKTYFCTRETKDKLELPFDFPIIVKHSNGINYWEHEFVGQKKVYRLNNLQDLQRVVNEIYQAGYSDSLTIQEFIPGHDSNLRVMICFSGKDKKVKLMSLAHVLLEEHTPHGLGNTGVLMNEYNEELSEKIKVFLENVGYVGFSTFDIKYDERDDKFKILEVNLRQGRSNYYVTGAGYNLAKYVTEEYVYNRDIEFEIVKNINLWTVIPLRVAFKYVKDEDCVAKMKQLVAEKKVINPLFMDDDNDRKRKFFLIKSHFSHYLKYRKYYRY